MPACLLLDGYTLDGYLAPQGPWPGVHFRYRPALAEETYEYLRQTGQAVKDAHTKVVVNFLASHLVGWDVVDSKGQPAAITPENLSRLPQPIVEALLGYVMGFGKEVEADAKN